MDVERPYAEWAPEPALAGRIACMWRQSASADRTQLVVPDGCVDLVWGPSGLFVAGPDTGPMPAPMRAGDTFDGIRFRPGAVGEVFGLPVDALCDQRVAAADLPVDLLGVPSSGGRLEVMRAAIIARLRVTSPADPSAAAIARALRTGRSVGEVAWELGFSERQLRRRSVASFGYGPKILQRVVRFQRALRLARAGVPLAEVAAVAGYADQAHLANDVKRLSGVTLAALRI
jgi:AraC-like DNA-binding protein